MKKTFSKKEDEVNILQVTEGVSEEEMDLVFEEIKKVAESTVEMKEVQEQFNIIEGVKEELEFFEKQIEKSKRESYIEFKPIQIMVIDKSKRESLYKPQKKQCPNVKTKVLFHGTSSQCVSSIIFGDFEMSKDCFFGKGIYFTDSIDYSRFYYFEGSKNYNNNKGFVPNVGSKFNVVGTEVFYDKSKKKPIYEIIGGGVIVKQNGIHKARVDGKNCCIPLGKNLYQQYKNGEKMAFNEYVVNSASQYLPMYAVVFERTEYFILWRDCNFVKGEPFYNELVREREWLMKRTGYNVYCETTTKSALELIKRKKRNKAIIITNVREDCNGSSGKDFVMKTRSLFGSDFAVLFYTSLVKHLEWIKQIPNALFSTINSLFEEFVTNFNIDGIKNLKEKIEELYRVKLNFNESYMSYPLFKGDGYYGDFEKLFWKETNITLTEVQFLEQLAGKKCGETVFDTNSDDWSVNTTFENKVLNKQCLMFIIEDKKGNVFGGYVNAKIQGFLVSDSQAIIFCMRRASKDVRKKHLIQPDKVHHAFWIADGSTTYLFGFGYDICVCKMNYKKRSFCCQCCFQYNAKVVGCNEEPNGS